MQKPFILCLAFSMLAVNASATPYVFGDPYPGTNGDVIGELPKFDIRQVRFLQLDAQLVRAEIDLNYDDGNLALGQFQVGGDWMNIGDLLFKVGSEYTYGVALQTHSNSPNVSSAYQSGGFDVVAGALYRINSGGVLSAWDVLENTCLDCYRPDEKVWLWNGGNGTVTKLQDAIINPVTVAKANPGDPNNPELLVSVAFVPDSTFMHALLTNTLSFQFAAATCANDIIDGKFAAVPEPATLFTLGAGLLGLGFLRRRKA